MIRTSCSKATFPSLPPLTPPEQYNSIVRCKATLPQILSRKYCQNPNSTIRSIQLSLRLLSKPKLNHQLNSTAFEVRIHSYPVIHPTNHHPTQTQLIYLNWEELTTDQLAGRDLLCVQLYSHTQTLYYVFVAEL